jgi:hypothetical protein
LYAQQNYCLTSAGKITARYSYNAHFKDVEGGCNIEGSIKTAGEPVEVKQGSYGSGAGLVKFEIAERRKGDDKAPVDWVL